MNENVEFTPSTGSRARAAVAGVLTGAMLGVVAWVAGSKMLLRMLDSEMAPYILPAAVVGAVLGVLLMWNATAHRIVITPTALEMYKGNRMWQSFDRATTRFGSQITTQRTNGIRTGVTRELKVTNASGEASYRVAGLTKSQFSTMINTLNPISGEEGLVSPEMRDQPVPTITYPIDAAAIRKPLTAQRVVFVIMLVGAAAAGGLVGYYAGEENVTTAMWGALIPTLVVLPMVIGIWASTGRKMRRIPAQFTVSSAGLTVDDTHFDPASIVRIEVTPPAYEVGFAGVTVVTTEKSREYFLGTAAKKDAVFTNYDAFIRHLAHATLRRPGLVHFDLG